ncbi:putative gp52 [Mycobacteroides abscessus]|nr:putative gp52 [Mycobacteroides abscessus MAB_110811_2726]EUA84275.1 putative gp52 [Mycobacteroides abscessus]
MQEAERIINGDRAEQYGDPKVMFERIAEFWTSYLYPFTEALTPVDVANMMVLLKISRSKAAVDRGEYHRDDHVDIAGYAGLTEKLADTVKAETVPRVWDKIINLSQKPS